MTVSALHIRHHPNLLTKKDHEELVKSLGGNIAEIKKKIDGIQEENFGAEEVSYRSWQRDLLPVGPNSMPWSNETTPGASESSTYLMADEKWSTKPNKAEYFNDLLLLTILEGTVAEGDLD